MRHCPLAFAAAALVAGTASAGELQVPGALDLRLSGESKFDVEYADGDFGFGEGPAGNPDPREWFFNQDHEIVFRATANDAARGIEYGVNLELELDTGGSSNGTNATWDEAWSFVKTPYGELRFGDEDAPAQNLAIAAEEAAFGTGGIDGDLRITPSNYSIEDSGEATKIIYYSPVLAGFQAGLSYTLNARDRGSSRGASSAAEDIVNVAGNYRRDLGALTLLLSGAAVFASAPDEAVTNWGVGAGIAARGVTLAGYYGDEEAEFSGDSLDGAGRDRVWNVGIGGEVLGNLGLSFNFQNDDFAGDASRQTYVLGASLPLLPGVVMHGDLGWQKQDRTAGPDIDGVNGLVQLQTLF